MPGRTAPYEGSHRLVRAGGVLDQQHQRRAVAHLNALEAPEGSPETRETRLDVVQSGAQGERKSACGKGVVDVVETRERYAHLAVASGRHEGERRALEPFQPDVVRRDVQGRPRVAAVRAAKLAEVPHVGGRVDIGGTADNAVFGICGVGETLPRHSGVVDAEAQDA